MSETDILVITEHWLWPYELHKLADISSNFDAHGISDYRFTLNSDLTRGCGGVGIIWKKSLTVVPIPCESDRVRAIEVKLPCGDTLTVIGTYLPCSLSLFNEELKLFAVHRRRRARC